MYLLRIRYQNEIGRTKSKINNFQLNQWAYSYVTELIDIMYWTY